MKLELLTQFPALSEETCFNLLNLDRSLDIPNIITV